LKFLLLGCPRGAAIYLIACLNEWKSNNGLNTAVFLLRFPAFFSAGYALQYWCNWYLDVDLAWFSGAAFRNKRNYKIVVILVLMTLLDGLFHLGELQLLPAVDLRQVLWTQLWLVIVLINVVGGRVIPAFTGNWLRRLQAAGTISVSAAMPADFGKPDILAIGLLVAFAGSVVLQLPVLLTAPLGLLCFMAQT